MESSNSVLGPGQEKSGIMARSQSEDVIDLRITSSANPHSEAVQALRKYLLRKMSSEESSGDKELDCTPEKVISVAETNGSKLYCSLVQRPIETAEEAWDRNQGKRTKCLAKHKSLDLDDSCSSIHSTSFEHGLRYLRTDLCIPVLHSKCSFCDDFFENEEQLRKHLRDFHFQYFLNYVQLRPLTSTKSLSDLRFSNALQISSSDSGLSSSSSVNRYENGWDLSGSGGSNNGGAFATESIFQSGKYYGKKPVKCDICGKCFTTKWNCKQHQKGHAKETITSTMMMDTSSTSGGELSPPLPPSSSASSSNSFQ